MRRFLCILLVAILLCSCNSEEEDSVGCTLPPEGFTKEDLIGTWVARYLTTPKVSDTLIIRGDGLYKQLIHLEVPAFDYESDWQPWRVEYNELGTPYLYMDGMLLYAYVPELIEKETIGGGDFYWTDLCLRKLIKMPPGEGVLIVEGVPTRFDQPPRGIELSTPSVSIEASPWTYILQE